MDEARLAVQQIVIARQQPSELLPRAPPIIALQVDFRLRVLTVLGSSLLD